MKNRKELIERLQTLLTNTRDEARRSGGHFDSESYDRGYHSGRAEMADSVLLWLGGILDAVGNFEGGVSGGGQAPKMRLLAYKGLTQDLILSGLITGDADIAIPSKFTEGGVVIKIREETENR